ncbi:MAG TPA: hypothetical protein VIJ05_06245, partial [Actinomycetes bacterium]
GAALTPDMETVVMSIVVSATTARRHRHMAVPPLSRRRQERFASTQTKVGHVSEGLNTLVARR